MSKKKILPCYGHKTGTNWDFGNKKGVNLMSVNPLILLVPRAGVEPARWVTTEGF
jgi:hypothetical protein